ncbi:ABC transporter permease [Kineosporia sp. J2-2]|uniref:ABC transporter permease n=1 Tax=Kineosporia corallincola TaxID=2835133 RepID=A0ABS5TBM8_9ACTN|nr:ABC transporter permease [Kineosporia corallincola]MBT0768460.1 ABC transporter permease [Kineosporia corallincola]
MTRHVLRALAPPVISILIALAVTTLFLTVSGYSAASAYQVMWQYGTQRNSLVIALNNAVPLYLAGIAAAFALRMGLFNIGVDGQYRVAALTGAVVAAALPFPAVITLPLTLLASAVAGGLWALVPALLKIYRGVNEVITSILMNAVATTTIAILLAHVFRADTGQDTGTRMIGAGGSMPDLFDLGDGNRTAVSGFLLVAVICGLVYHLVQRRSVFGYTLQVAALSPDAAASAGIPVNRRVVQAMLWSGGVAGLVGLPHVLGVAHRYDGTMPTDLMFLGLAAALLGRSHPVGTALGAYVLAFVERSSQVLGLVRLPTEVGELFIAVVLLSSAVAYWIVEHGEHRFGLWARARRRSDPVEVTP